MMEFTCENAGRRTVELISIYDYPKAKFSAFWEIVVLSDGKQFMWKSRLYDYTTSKQVEYAVGVENSRDEADTAAQEFVLAQMPN